MKDEPRDIMEGCIEDAVLVANILTEEDTRQYNSDHVLQIVGMLYQERMQRVNQEWMEERMKGDMHNDGDNSRYGGGAWQ